MLLILVAIVAKAQTIQIDNQSRSQVCVEIWVLAGGCGMGTPTLSQIECIDPYTTSNRITLSADAVGVRVSSAGLTTWTAFGDPCFASSTTGAWSNPVWSPAVPTYGSFSGGSTAFVTVWD